MPWRSSSWASVFMPLRSMQPKMKSTPASFMARDLGPDAVGQAEGDVVVEVDDLGAADVAGVLLDRVAGRSRGQSLEFSLTP